MNDLIATVDWSRAQFALTAMYHWLFVPLTIGMALIVAVMETIYYRTRSQRWLGITKFWMALFGINFAIGVATGLILEFEFGTNWSNYSWFVGDIFGAPLAIEGIFAFFLEATFVAVMFFGWRKVSPGFHLTATWLTTFGVALSAWWILVANAWMQYPVGMEFDPDQMRNVMTDFWAVALSPVAINKFLHAVFSCWTLAGVFVLGVSAWMLWRGRSRQAAIDSIKVASWVGLAGIVLTMWSGDGSAVNVAKVQPMKLAAMEGLYDGKNGQHLVAFGILNTDKQPGDSLQAIHAEVAIPYGLSILAAHDSDAFVPGINDLIKGVSLTNDGDTVNTVSYADRIAMGRQARAALQAYGAAREAGDSIAAAVALSSLKDNYKYFGYGYLDQPEDAVPPVALTFYAFRVMVMTGGYLLLMFVVALWSVYRKPGWYDKRWMLLACMVSVPLVWVCSQAGWVLAEVGRQPWTIQDLLPVQAAVSAIPSDNVILTFCVFAVLFTVLLAAEVSIMLRYIGRNSKAVEATH